MSEVLSPVANRFASGATLTHASAKAALAAGLERIAAGARGVDCTPLTQFDSSALAVLLAWQRAAQARGGAFQVVNLPAGLASLAQAYGVDTLITGAAQGDRPN
ncbi:MAG: Phospholipid ABC transporter-binding protein MlaB [uncultured Paraburkholderia sp.]|nr:MAG: Phospholipid ABC transporter-binding protein MlaB [uncultured Paraburkholderia sp.]CAH2796459.1 MAG: Phospholipid ABC transporter-binding protein MlaB [uncultured Paraburkholderia sp.]CAH2930865.1 MAG: Phospholipid ABC transporter-binding protein MlaB [uncultured Paraburkholderia sp.]CAH2931971.1 MAG: Phospholipid ABC transporter-binding protein MlaB [uncultured Paraburkholderia sp.]